MWCRHADISMMTSAAWCHVRVRASEHVCMCAYLLSFSALFWSEVLMRWGCVRVHVYMSVYVACFVFRCEVKISVLSWSVSASRMRMNVYLSVCECVYNTCVCVWLCVRASESARVSESYVCELVRCIFLPFPEAKYVNALRERERESVCVCVCVRARARARASAYACVLVRYTVLPFFEAKC